jgi:hypothetical protein
MLLIFIAASMGVAASLSILIWYKLSVILLVCIYGQIIIWQFGLLRAPDSIVRLRCFPDGKWLVQTNRQQYEAILKGDSTVTTFISVLQFKAQEKRWPITCVIFPDSLQADWYRQLLVVVRKK